MPRSEVAKGEVDECVERPCGGGCHQLHTGQAVTAVLAMVGVDGARDGPACRPGFSAFHAIFA